MKQVVIVIRPLVTRYHSAPNFLPPTSFVTLGLYSSRIRIVTTRLRSNSSSISLYQYPKTIELAKFNKYSAAWVCNLINRATNNSSKVTETCQVFGRNLVILYFSGLTLILTNQASVGYSKISNSSRATSLRYRPIRLLAISTQVKNLVRVLYRIRMLQQIYH